LRRRSNRPHLVYNASTRPPTIVRGIHGARDWPEVLRDLSLSPSELRWIGPRI